MQRLPSMQTLRAFEAAARLESYSGAALELGLTHGAISHRVRELEQQLGFTLFRRTGRSMIPTREAVTLLAQVREALALLQQALPDNRHATEGRLVISVHPSLATRWLVPRIGGFLRVVPDVTIEVRSIADLGDFLSHGINVAIRYGSGVWGNAMCERLSGEVLFPVCSPGYLEAHRIQKPADLRRCRLLRHAWQPWQPWLRAAGVPMKEPSCNLTLSDTAMLLEAAAAGEGIALARSLFASDDLRRGRLVRLFDTVIEDGFAYHLTWPPGRPLSPAGAAFRQWLREEMRATGEPKPAASIEAKRASRARKARP